MAGSLPKALAQAGHEVKVILPLYEGISGEWRSQMTFLKYFNVTLSWRQVYCGIFQLERDGVVYWFVDNEYYFKRWQIYGHFDDCERFAYFSRAVIETPGQLDWWPDVIHCNDWQTALVPVYLLEDKYRIPQLGNAKSVFTIHNIEYQGRYGDQVLEDVIGLGRNYFNEGMLAFHKDVNLMKGAIMASTYVTTVSPSYAQELRMPFYAHGMDAVINQQSGKLQGILNGIDMQLYDPATKSGLAAHFTAEDPTKGKRACKLALQRAVGLREDESVPIIACVSRLVKHKGFDLVTAAIHDIMAMDVQMVVLGTGDWGYEEAFRQAQAQYPGRFSANIMYSAALSNAIYSGADLFLMPSEAEPCGLSQMIAMRYGTLPVVRETGGLKDSVRPNGVEGATGFTFANINAQDMVWVLGEAVGLYYNNPDAWHYLQHNAMTADFSWNRSAEDYLQIYNWITGKEMHPGRPFEAGAGESEASAQTPVTEEAAPAEETPAPAEEPAQEPAPAEAAPVDEPAPAALPAEESAPAPAVLPVEENIPAPAVPPVEESAPAPAEEPPVKAAKKPAARKAPAKKTTRKTAKAPADETAKKPARKTAAKKTTKKAAEEK